MHTKRKANNFLHERITLRESLLVAFAISSFAVLSFSSDTSATVYTASITASPTVTVDLSTNKEADVKSDNVVVNSTCPLGYNLTIVGPSNSNLYKGGDSTASAINATSGTSASPKAITGEGNLDTWGYSLDSNTTISSNTFIGLTNTTNTLINKTSASATSGDTTTIYYGASTSTNKEPGTYTMADSGAITYALTTDINCSSFEIVYDGNDDDGNTTMSVEHSNVQEGDDITLYASNYIKAGYGFAGWSTVELDPDSTNFQTDLTAAVAAHKVYGPNETITTDSTFLNQAENINGTNTITLYAVWVAPTGTIQNWTGCGRMSIGDITALTDQRDNNVYTVARLADGNCWMVENLRLDNQYTMGNNTTDPTVTNESLAQGYGDYWSYASGGWTHYHFVGLANSETANFEPSTTQNSVYVSDGSSTTYDPTTTPVTLQDIGNVTGTESNVRFPRYNNNNTFSTVADMQDSEENVYSYGNYYTWSAAVADFDYYGDNTAGQSVTSTSICPTSWHLPKGSNGKNGIANSDYWKLIVTGINHGVNPINYNSEDNPYYIDNDNTEGSDVSKLIRSFPNNFLYSGRVTGSTSSGLSRGTVGGYWSSTISAGAASRYLFINSTRVGPGNNSVSKSRGYTLRCIVQPHYTVHFNANGGTGTMTDQNIYRGQATNLNTSTFIPPANERFLGWNTEADGSGTSYTDEESVTNIAAAYGSITLYAQWSTSYLITYNANQGSGYLADQVVELGNSVDLRDNAFTRTDYYFKGWATSPSGSVVYRPSENITPNSSLDLYAVWGASPNTKLYDAVESLTRGTQDDTTIQNDIAKGNSGVYTYNSSVFGASSDAANTKDIYYYRGILDTDLGGTGSTYGSNGNAMNYPNYVRLGETCWRIVRTTGSGGTKMIYNGQWTGSTCAHATTDAQVTTQAFGRQGNSSQSVNWYQNINRVGYTFNNTASLQDSTSSTALTTVFGGNSNYSTTNTANSNIKNYIENTWFNNAIGAYTGMLEPDAGYCNDRTVYEDAYTIKTTPITPYGANGAERSFGAWVRTQTSSDTRAITLACPSSRNTVDLYTTSSAARGNKQLSKPVALLTADEVSFAGIGRTVDPTLGYPSTPNNYLYSGERSWLLSPYKRSINSVTSVYVLDGPDHPGGLGWGAVQNAYGVRPVVSLNHNSIIASGSGTATNPWEISFKVVTEPGYISYSPNVSDVVDTMGDQAVADTDTSAMLWASNFQRPGYGFAGWSDAPDYVVNEGSATNPNAHIYGPNETIEFTAGQYSGEGLSLYAVWVPNAGNLQSWSGCSDLGEGDVTALTDQRDNNVYAVAKLADGKCWMIENLRIEATGTTGNTNKGWSQGYGGVFTALATAESSNFANTTAANSLYSTSNITGTGNAYRFPRYNNANTKSPVANMTTPDANIYSYGNYYTWAAAKANTVAMTTVSASDGSNTSICPKGWRLPLGSTSSAAYSFGSLSLALGGLNTNMSSSTNPTGAAISSVFRQYPNNIILSGAWVSSAATQRNANGYLWSSTSNSSATDSNTAKAFYESFSTAYFNPGTSNDAKYHGRSIRCVLGD